MVHSSRSLPPLDTLEAFTVTARTGSFSAAAAELGLTHGAISRQMARLERWMGVKLFQRAARGVELTPEGTRFLTRAGDALNLLGAAEDRWQPRRGPSVVRLSLTPSVATLWLFQRLEAIEGDDFHLELELENRLADLADGTDLAIRCGCGPWAADQSIELWQESVVPVAAPALARRIERDGPAARLLAFPLLHDSNAEAWRRWFAGAGIAHVPRATDRRFEDYNVVLDACASGLGLALARPSLASDAIRDGRIVVIDERASEDPASYRLIRSATPMRRPVALAARRLLEAIGRPEQEIAAFLDPGGVASLVAAE